MNHTTGRDGTGHATTEGTPLMDAMDVADFFIDTANEGDPEEDDGMTNMKLNKLMFFAQAASLQRFGTPLFDKPLEHDFRCLISVHSHEIIFNMTYFSLGEFLKRTGVSASTAYRAERKGVITPTRTNGGHRRYTQEDVARLLGLQHQNPEKKCVIYCRVSSAGQKNDLADQKKAMMEFATARGHIYEVWEEIGGGMNFNRPKFLRLVNGIIDGQIGTVIVAHKDRLTRFGFDLIQNLADQYGAEIIVANRTDMSPQQEMVEDLMSIIHTYSCRLYGLRRYKTSRDLLGTGGE